MQRKLIILGAALIVVVLLSHIVWTLVEGKSMRRRVAALKAVKEPILPADLNVTDEADNSSADILAAAGKVDWRSDRWKAVDKFNLHLPLRDDERKAIEAILAETKPALELLDQARKKPRNEWPVQLQSPVLNSMISDDFGKVRALCSMLRTLALYEHDRGNDAAALRHLETSIFLGEYVDTFPSIVGHLVSIGARAVAANYAAEIGPDLRIGTAPGNASPADVRGLIDALLDDRGSTAGEQRALRGERMMQLDTMESFGAGNPPTAPTVVPTAKPSGVMRYVMRPIIYRNARIMLDHMTQMIPAAASADFPAATTDQDASAAAAQGSVLNPFVRILLPGMERFLQTHFRGITDRRLAATALAIRWYAVEHDGKLPDSLDQLVPKYLPAVPADPFQTDGKKLLYKRDGEKPVVYSVGNNGTDDGGVGASPEVSEWHYGEDRVDYLTRQPRKAEEPDPATQPSVE